MSEDWDSNNLDWRARASYWQHEAAACEDTAERCKRESDLARRRIAELESKLLQIREAAQPFIVHNDTLAHPFVRDDCGSAWSPITVGDFRKLAKAVGK